jgi:hypothetical protein
MAARANRQILAEGVDRLVATTLAGACRQGYLMGPAAIDRRWRQFALAVDHLV